jgi:ComF family protein
MRHKLTTILKNTLNIFFPNHCLYCEKIINREALFCTACWSKLKFITDPKCKICSYPFEIELIGKSANLPCSKCIKDPPHFDKVVTIFRYNEIIKKIISNLKYHDQTFIAKKIAKLLFNKIKPELENIDYVAIIPLHQNKIKKRKFNQVALISKEIAKHDPKKYISDLLFRTKETQTQVKLTQQQRQSNIKRAFMVNKKHQDRIMDKTILLIDDVMTSGATIEACSKALKKRKAKKIIVLTLAKTVLKR